MGKTKCSRLMVAQHEEGGVRPDKASTPATLWSQSTALMLRCERGARASKHATALIQPSVPARGAGWPASSARSATTALVSALPRRGCAAGAGLDRRRPRDTLQPAFRALFSADRSDWQRFDEIFAAYWTGAVQPPHPGRHRRGRGQCPAPPRQAWSARPQGRRAEQGRAPAGRRGHRRRGQGPSRGRFARRAARRRRHAPHRRPRGDRRDPCAGRAAGADDAGAHRPPDAGAAERPAPRPPPHHPPEHLARRHADRPRLPAAEGAPLRLVVLLDASGSMSLYTAFFVRFLHGVVDASARRRPSSSTPASPTSPPCSATGTSSARSTACR